MSREGPLEIPDMLVRSMLSQDLTSLQFLGKRALAAIGDLLEIMAWAGHASKHGLAGRSFVVVSRSRSTRCGKRGAQLLRVERSPHSNET